MDPNRKLFYAKLEEGNRGLGDKNRHLVKDGKVSKI